MEFIIFGFILRLVFAIVIGNWGEKKNIGFGWSFFFTLLLGVYIGAIIVLCSRKKTEFLDMTNNEENI